MAFSCFNQSLTGTRRTSSPSIVKGELDALGADTPLAFEGSVQPVTGQDLLSVPEGRRKDVVKRILTTFKLEGVDEDDSINPDRVNLEDGEYEVIKVEAWQNGIISHYDVLVSRINQCRFIIHFNS